jgi:hypothetical protein
MQRLRNEAAAGVPAAHDSAQLSDTELDARLAASRALRKEAEAMLRTPQFHRAAREARKAGDALVLARHLRTLRPDGELARCPDVFLALANRDYPGAEVQALWEQHAAAAGQLDAARAAAETRAVAAEARAAAAEARAVAVEAREARLMERAVAMAQRTGQDPHRLLFGGAETEAEQPRAQQPLQPGAAVEAAPAAPPEEDGRKRAASVPPAEKPSAKTARCDDAGDEPQTKPCGDAAPIGSAAARADDSAAPGGTPRGGSGVAAGDAEANAAINARAAAVQATSMPPTPLVLQPGAASLPVKLEQEEDQCKRASFAPSAEEPHAKAARGDDASNKPPRPKTSGGAPANAAAAHADDAAAPGGTPGNGSDAAAGHAAAAQACPAAIAGSAAAAAQAVCAATAAHAALAAHAVTADSVVAVASAAALAAARQCSSPSFLQRLKAAHDAAAAPLAAAMVSPTRMPCFVGCGKTCRDLRTMSLHWRMGSCFRAWEASEGRTFATSAAAGATGNVAATPQTTAGPRQSDVDAAVKLEAEPAEAPNKRDGLNMDDEPGQPEDDGESDAPLRHELSAGGDAPADASGGGLDEMVRRGDAANPLARALSAVR